MQTCAATRADVIPTFGWSWWERLGASQQLLMTFEEAGLDVFTGTSAREGTARHRMFFAYACELFKHGRGFCTYCRSSSSSSNVGAGISPAQTDLFCEPCDVGVGGALERLVSLAMMVVLALSLLDSPLQVLTSGFIHCGRRYRGLGNLDRTTRSCVSFRNELEKEPLRRTPVVNWCRRCEHAMAVSTTVRFIHMIINAYDRCK